MTNPASPPPLPPTRLPVPQERLVYQRLPTDFYPWTEVLSDLERRLDPTFSAILDVQDQGRWARFVWVRGAARGGVGAGGRDVPLDVTMRSLPRAQVSLALVDPLVAEIVWTCRASAARPMQTPWPAAYDQLVNERFHGALISGPHCSFWDSGRVVTGALPQSGMPCVTVSNGPAQGNVNLVPFWQKLVLVTHRANPAFSEAWRQVSMQLSGKHPVLDPFANEVRVLNGQLQVDKDANPKELKPALLAAYLTTLRRLGLRLNDVPAGELRRDEHWRAAGLEEQ
ncbi:hypothetical protein [Deinococcus fonticola]|uniref:hypothetical protein n=1 Tax=Deinococcus fonticola TaxID=2528713 RepID=UPI001075598A|nr:hypothetical protein [Deinococcus fonticola]